jgi:hypothetical protein
MSTYTISSQPFYDDINQCYKNIVTIDREPTGPLAQIVKTLRTPRLSPFNMPGPCSSVSSCIVAIYKVNDASALMTPDDIPTLFGFLTQNGYTINTALTTMMNESQVKMSNKLICFISF